MGAPESGPGGGGSARRGAVNDAGYGIKEVFTDSDQCGRELTCTS